jgi:hypothetical protein
MEHLQGDEVALQFDDPRQAAGAVRVLDQRKIAKRGAGRTHAQHIAAYVANVPVNGKCGVWSHGFNSRAPAHAGAPPAARQGGVAAGCGR